MIDGISGEAIYKCSNCGAKYFLHAEDFDFDAQSGSERQMGAETQYIAEIDTCCRNCNDPIQLEFEVWEYPLGVMNYTTEKAVGAEIEKSEFSFEHRPDPDDGVVEAAKLAKPLLQFRFDKFSEQFVEYWIRQYKKDARATSITSAFALVLGALAVGVGIYSSERQAGPHAPRAQDFKEQFSLLKTTQRNLNDLESFISSKKNEIVATQTLLGELKEQRATIEPLVKANQEVVDAMFAQQRRENEKYAWRERLIGFGFGILASLIASIVWHFVGKLGKKRGA